MGIWTYLEEIEVLIPMDSRIIVIHKSIDVSQKLVELINEIHVTLDLHRLNDQLEILDYLNLEG